MVSGGLSQWDGSDKTEIASHIRQVESYFVVKDIEDEQKKLPFYICRLKVSRKYFSQVCHKLKLIRLLTQKQPSRNVLSLSKLFKPFKTEAFLSLSKLKAFCQLLLILSLGSVSTGVGRTPSAPGRNCNRAEICHY